MAKKSKFVSLLAAALLQAVPKDIDLAKDYGLSKIPTLPVVDMVALTREVATLK